MSDTAADTYTRPPHGWTCFHCGETFTTVGAARDHFGADQLATPACQIKAGEELGLVMALRRAEAELEKWRSEERDAATYHALTADHARALVVAEQTGYDKGLADGRAETAARNPL